MPPAVRTSRRHRRNRRNCSATIRSPDFEHAQQETLQTFGADGVIEKTGPSLGIAFSDQLLHGWDLARATGQDATMPDGLAQAAYDMIHGRFTDEQRKGTFKPEIAVGAGCDGAGQAARLHRSHPVQLSRAGRRATLAGMDDGQANTPRNALGPLAGTWEGTNGFRLMPADELHRAPATATVTPAAGGHDVVVTYTWVHPQDGPQDGIMLVGSPDEQGKVTAAWGDSWHQQPSIRTLVGHRRRRAPRGQRRLRRRLALDDRHRG